MIFETIKTIVSTYTKQEVVTMEMSFREDLGVDSLTLFQIVNDIEDECHVQIADTTHIITIGDAVRFVENEKEKE